MKTYICLTNATVVFPVDTLPLQWWSNSQTRCLHLAVVFLKRFARILLTAPWRCEASYNMLKYFC